MHHKQNNTNQDKTFFLLPWVRFEPTTLWYIPRQILLSYIPGQLSSRDSKSTTQHNARKIQTPNNSVHESGCARQVYITNEVTPTGTTPFSKEKGAPRGGTRTHDTPLPRQSALPTELLWQLSRQGVNYMCTHLLCKGSYVRHIQKNLYRASEEEEENRKKCPITSPWYCPRMYYSIFPWISVAHTGRPDD